VIFQLWFQQQLGGVTRQFDGSGQVTSEMLESQVDHWVIGGELVQQLQLGHPLDNHFPRDPNSAF
jgi:hypothetical protein